MDDLKARLRTETPFRFSNDGMTVAELPPPGKLRNPDGPEAADRIERLEATLQAIADFTADENGRRALGADRMTNGQHSDALAKDQMEHWRRAFASAEVDHSAQFDPALMTRQPLMTGEQFVHFALEASHHTELVEALKEAAPYVWDRPVYARIEALLAKIGGEA